MITKKQVKELPYGFTPIPKTGRFKSGKSMKHKIHRHSRKQYVNLKDENGVPTGKTRLITHLSDDNRKKGFDQWKRKSMKLD